MIDGRRGDKTKTAGDDTFLDNGKGTWLFVVIVFS